MAPVAGYGPRRQIPDTRPRARNAVVLRKLDQHVRKEHQLSLSWYDVLAQLSLAAGRLRMTDLASSILVTSSGLTRLLDRMEDEGLIARESCLEDRRGYWAVLTEDGRRAFSEITPSHLKRVNRHFLTHLDEVEISALNSIFSKILDAEDNGSLKLRRPKI